MIPMGPYRLVLFKALKSFILTSAEQYHNQKSWLAETKSHFLSSIKGGFLASNEEIFNQMMNMCVMYDQQSVTLFFTALLFPAFFQYCTLSLVGKI